MGPVMKFWTLLLLLIGLCTIKTNGTNEKEQDETSSNMFTPQFLHDDSLFSVMVPTNSTNNVTQDVIKVTPNVSTTQIYEDVRTTNENSDFNMKLNTSISKVNFTEVTKFENLNEDLNVGLNNDTSENIVNATNVPQLKQTETIDNTTFKINTTEINTNTTSNISVIYSKPYQAGKNLFDFEKVDLVFPSNKTDEPNDDKIEILKIHKTVNVSDRRKQTSNKKEENINRQNEKNTTSLTPEITVKDRMQQIRHILYHRRPAIRYLLKVKNNEKLNNDKNENIKSLHTDDAAQNISTTLKEFPNHKLETLNNDTGIFNRSRKRYQTVLPTFGNKKHNILVDKNINDNSTQVEVIINGTQSEKKLNSNITIDDSEQVNLNETIIDVVSRDNITVPDSNKYDNSTVIKNIEEKGKVNNQNTTKFVPFRPSPEYNPNETSMYDMSMLRFGHRFIITKPNPRTYINQEPITEGENTTSNEPKPTRSILENMMQMVRNLRRLPKRQQPKYKITDDDISNSFGNSNHNLELVENYESKKLKPTVENTNVFQQNQPSQNSASGNGERGANIPKLESTLLNTRNNVRKPSRRPVQFHRLNKPNLENNTPISQLHLTITSNNKINPKPNISQIEQTIKTNILKELARIRMQLQSRVQSNKSINLSDNIQNGVRNEINTMPQRSNIKINNNLEFNGNVQLRASKSRINHNQQEPVNTSPNNNLNKQRTHIRQRLRYYGTKPNIKDNHNNEKNSNIPQRLRYQEIKTNDNNNNEDKTHNDNNEKRLNIPQRLRYQEIKTNDKTSNNDEDKNDNDNNDKRLNVPQRLRHQEIKTNDETNNNEHQTLSTITTQRKNIQSKHLRRLNRFKLIKQNKEHIISENNGLENIEKVNNTTNMNNITTFEQVNDVKETNFNEKDFELSGSSSENNATIITEVETKNETINNSTQNSDVKMDDLETLQSERNEKSIYNGQFVAPSSFQNGFTPMIINSGGVALRPIGLKTIRHLDNTLITPPGSQQIQQFDIASPNLLTYYSRTGQITGPEIIQENRSNTEQVSNQQPIFTKTEELKNKNTTSTYETALKQYNEALKMYNNYLEHFLKDNQK